MLWFNIRANQPPNLAKCVIFCHTMITLRINRAWKSQVDLNDGKP
ncbi:hypothetical protein MuYL_3370 [Mucilaginibacter xinganensis]|uniref:Uncharacterized protein n=1 Tax=Mucilaginibacter xinganensis TaxID=1234841 RepID=A0A223NZH2_9SPHI|nr:hypothetical protein MuYL_3370 [Mucilaginibacter xinganensis]